MILAFQYTKWKPYTLMKHSSLDIERVVEQMLIQEVPSFQWL